MMLGARTAAWAGKALPYDAEVEWIRGDGSAYVDTGFDYSQETDEVSIEFNVAGSSAWNRNIILGAYESGSTNFWISISTGGMLQIIFANSQRSYSITGDAVVTLVGKTVSANGEQWTFTGDYIASLPLFMFGRNNNGAVDNRNSTVKIYSFVARRNGVVILDLIPVKFTNSLGVSEGAMYDRVSDKLFRNQGTGAFVIGPDKTT